MEPERLVPGDEVVWVWNKATGAGLPARVVEIHGRERARIAVPVPAGSLEIRLVRQENLRRLWLSDDPGALFARDRDRKGGG